jgi:dihydropteroate synthase
MLFHCGTYRLDLSRPQVMGIVNITPDSFSDGGQFTSTRQAIEHGLRLIEEGADILDIGGESTRPYAKLVALDEELRRVIPVIEGLASNVDVPISIDTYKPEVMRAAIAAGASLVNDVRALQEPGAMEVVASSSTGVCLMHMLGTPQTMQVDPQYENVVEEVCGFLHKRALACEATGIDGNRIMLDPGFGFGKRSMHNIALLRELGHICALGYPVLVGLSRKSVLGQITGNSVEDRLPGSLAAAVIATMKGASIVRVHDVKATRDAMRVVQAVSF